MKRKFKSAILLMGCLFSGISYAHWSLPTPHTTATEPSLVKLTHPYLPYTVLPKPAPTLIPPKTLTLHDSIMLALRFSPDVKSSEIQRIVDKYSVILAQQEFRPKYTFKTKTTVDHESKPIHSLTSSASLKTPLGSEFSVNYTNALNGGAGGTTLSWKQPLLKGFGAVNTVSYFNALEGEEVAKLTFKNSIIQAVFGVITAYRQLVQDYNSIAIQKRTLKQTAESLKQYELRVKVGKMAASDIYQQKSTYESTKLALIQQQDSLQRDYQTFLKALGLVPFAKIQIQKKVQVKRYRLPNKEVAIQRALDGNIAYRSAVFGLENTRRGIITAVDARRWTLDVQADATLGQAGKPLGLFFGRVGSGPTLMFDLDIPLDDVSGKSGEINARVSYEQGKLKLAQQKETLIADVLAQMRTVSNSWQQVLVSRRQVEAQAQTLKASRLKVNYGKATVFEVSQNQDLLLSQETSLVSTEISYLNSITTLQNLWGNTLDVWGVQLRY